MKIVFTFSIINKAPEFSIESLVVGFKDLLPDVLVKYRGSSMTMKREKEFLVRRSTVNKYPTCNFSKNIDSGRVDLLPYTTRSRCRDRKHFNAAQLRYTGTHSIS